MGTQGAAEILVFDGQGRCGVRIAAQIGTADQRAMPIRKGKALSDVGRARGDTCGQQRTLHRGQLGGIHRPQGRHCGAQPTTQRPGAQPAGDLAMGGADQLRLPLKHIGKSGGPGPDGAMPVGGQQGVCVRNQYPQIQPPPRQQRQQVGPCVQPQGGQTLCQKGRRRGKFWQADQQFPFRPGRQIFQSGQRLGACQDRLGGHARDRRNMPLTSDRRKAPSIWPATA